MKFIRIQVTEPYKPYQSQVTELPEKIICGGETLNIGRNLTKKISISNANGKSIDVVVKSFAIPNRIRGYIDTKFRQSKALRSKNNAERLLEMGVQTPDPIACIEKLKFHCLHQSFYISRYWDHNYDLGSFLYRGVSSGANTQVLLYEISRFTAKQHELGIKHLDYNPGNILTRSNGDSFEFCLVDLNRLRFTNLSREDRITGLVRLSTSAEYMKTIGSHYAVFSRTDPVEFCRLLKEKHTQFWSRRIRLKRILKILK